MQCTCSTVHVQCSAHAVGMRQLLLHACLTVAYSAPRFLILPPAQRSNQSARTGASTTMAACSTMGCRRVSSRVG